MTHEPSKEQLKVKLLEERGESSRFVDAEINEDGPPQRY